MATGVFTICTLFVLSSCPVLNTAAPVVQTVGGCWLSCCPVLNTAAPVVRTAGECWCICEPMYRGPPRGPCIGFIYPTLLGFGGIQAIILSYKFSYLFGAINCSLIPCRLTKLISNSKGFRIYLGQLAIFLSELVFFAPWIAHMHCGIVTA